MLAKESPEVVFVVTNSGPDYLPVYPKISCECMQAGAHVWIEKPPAASVAEIREMMRVSTETGSKLGVGFKKMFFPAVQKARHLSLKPEFGELTSITARYPQTLPAREMRSNPEAMQGFLDHMVHPHSMLKCLAGELDSILIKRNHKVSSAMVSLQFKSGAIGNLHFCAGISGHSFLERTEMVGIGSNIVIDNNLRVIYYRQEKGLSNYGRTTDAFRADTEDAALYWEPEFSLGQLYNKGLFLLGYAPEIIHFTANLLDNKAPEFGTLEDALEMMKIYEAYQKADDQIIPV
jgi:predicted dehydrogenase